MIDESLGILPDTKIFDKDTTLIGTTDFDGYFEVNISENTSELIFAWLLHEWAYISVPEDCDYLEVILLEGNSYDFMSSTKVDRLRRKQFERLSELHKKAFKSGFFKSEKPCFNQTFKPIKSELDEIGRQMKLTKKQIKAEFKELAVGDTVKVPSSSWSAYTDGTDFGCLITGTIIEKNKKKGGYNLILKVTDNLCENNKATYNGNLVKVGDSITHNMKYLKILTE